MSTTAEFVVVAGSAVVGGLMVSKTYDFLMTKVVRDLMKLRELDRDEVMEATWEITKLLVKNMYGGNTFIVRLMIFTSSSLVKSIAKISEQIVSAPKENKKAKTIVGLMLGEKLNKSSKAQLFLGVALIINAFIFYLTSSPAHGYTLGLITVFLLLIHVDHKLIEYRIKKGWYGKNEFETREIIEFILSHADKNDFNDSGGLKKVIPPPEIVKQADRVFLPGGVSA